MLEKGKVSIVVPLYKVEKYIHRCIDSIRNQTYTRLEIILVNDGSPDNCGSIAAGYEERDNRIRVIHKENGGLSDARNYGIQEVTGEYTMFVDGDDWIETNMIETMLTHMITNESDIVQAAFYYAYEDKLLADHRHFREHDRPVVLNKKQLMYELVVNEQVKNFAWGKLYKTALIKDIPFKKGVLFEDVFWAHQVMHRVETYLILHQPFYFYYQRSDSIVATYNAKNLDSIRGLIERHAFIEKYYKELTNESYKTILNLSLIHYNLLLIHRRKDERGVCRKKIKVYIQDNYQILKQAVKNDKELKRQLYLFSLHPYFNFLFLGIRKGLRIIKILPAPEGLKKIKT